MCNQTAGLIARALEESGISTVMISLLGIITEQINPPRALEVPFGFGFPLGQPNNVALQIDILNQCLRMLKEVKEPGTIWNYSI